MRLLLSTACLPAASPEELLRARQRRSLAGFEVDVRPEHLSGGSPHFDAQGNELLDDVSWYRLPSDVPEHVLMLWASRAHASSAGIIVPDIPPAPLGVPTAIECSAGSDSCECAPAGRFAVQPCWNLSVDNLPDRGKLDVLLAYEATRPVHIRLAGAGPEVMDPEHEELAVLLGTFFADLAMLGYNGTLSLVPSGQDKLDLWRRWLLNLRGWGCGTAAEKQRRRRLQAQTQ